MHQLVASAAQAAADLGQRQFEAGNLSELDLTHERMSLQEARVAVARQELKLAAARESLNHLLGLKTSELGWSADGRLPELPAGEIALEDLEPLAIARSLDMLAAKQEVEASARALSLASWSRVPAVRAGVSAEREIDSPTVIGPIIELELPLFSRNQGEVARAEAELRRSELRLQAAEDRVLSEVRAARTKLLAARDLVEYYRKSVIPLRQHAVLLAQQHYNKMLLGVYELLRTKRLEVDALREGNDALREYWLSRVELERVMGASIPRRSAGALAG